MSIEQDYQKVIDILYNKDKRIRFKDLIIEVSKKHPDIVVRAYNTIVGIPDWRKKVEELIRAGDKVRAIKCYRELHPGVSLIEARNIIYKIAEEIGMPYQEEKVHDIDIQPNSKYYTPIPQDGDMSNREK